MTPTSTYHSEMFGSLNQYGIMAVMLEFHPIYDHNKHLPFSDAWLSEPVRYPGCNAGVSPHLWPTTSTYHSEMFGSLNQYGILGVMLEFHPIYDPNKHLPFWDVWLSEPVRHPGCNAGVSPHLWPQQAPTILRCLALWTSTGSWL